MTGVGKSGLPTSHLFREIKQIWVACHIQLQRRSGAGDVMSDKAPPASHWVSGSVERGLHPPQLLLDLPRLRLTGPLELPVAVRGQEVDGGGGELGDAAAKVRLQLPVGAVREGGLLEGPDLARHLRDVPWRDESKRKSQHASVNIKGPFFPPSPLSNFVCDLIRREPGLTPAAPGGSSDPSIWIQPHSSGPETSLPIKSLPTGAICRNAGTPRRPARSDSRAPAARRDLGICSAVLERKS